MKFDDCHSCAFRRKKSVCAECDMGELYEDAETPGVDMAFREVPVRFGESVRTDDNDEEVSPDVGRFLDFQPDPDEAHDDDAED